MQSWSEHFTRLSRASVGFWLNGASRLLLRLHDERLRPLGFSMGQLPVLLALMDGSALSQKEIVQRVGVKQPSMAEMLARMEREGVARRAADPDDGRGSLTSLTDSAMERMPAALELLKRGERDATLGLTAREIETLRTLLERVVGNLRALEGAEAAPAPTRKRR